MMNEKELKRLQFGTSHRLTKDIAEMLSMDITYGGAVYDAVLDAIVLSIRGNILVDEVAQIEVKYPLDWWQAFRERWFPKCLLKRSPVQYNTQSLSARILYPHILLNKDSQYVLKVGIDNNAYDYGTGEPITIHT